MKKAPNTEDLTVTAQREFAAWLESSQAEPFDCQIGEHQYTILRVAKNAEFDYLYCQRNFFSQSIQSGVKFDYAGIFCKADGLVYDVNYDLRNFVDAAGRSRDELQSTLKNQVRQAVESAIANDRRNLTVKKLNEEERKDVLHFKQFSAGSVARSAYLKAEDGSFPFRCYYSPAYWSENSLLDYIGNPALYTQKEAKVYIVEHQEAMLQNFLENDAAREAYRAIIENPKHQAHCVKRIIEATSGTDAKTFRVTIRKDGQKFTFKAEADEFRYDHAYYFSWHIEAKDRREFERQFGYHCNYLPGEIVRIEYGRNVLYEANEAEH